MLKKLLLSILLLGSAVGFADPVATNGRDFITLHKDACTLQVAKDRAPQYFADMKMADTIINGQPFKACYVEVDGAVFLLFEDGDTAGPIMKEAFKEGKEA